MKISSYIFCLASIFGHLFFQSCSEPHMDFEVTKKTDDLLDSIRISTTERESLQIIELNDCNKFNYRLDMETEYFGYYTNGYLLNDGFTIIITNDMPIISEY